MLETRDVGPVVDDDRPHVNIAVDAVRRCLGDHAGRFTVELWDRAPLYVAQVDQTAFADLFSSAAVDELVSSRGLRTPFARMAREGSVLPERSFTRSGGSGATIADQIADDKVLAQLAGGATLVLQALHRTWPPLVEFGSSLAAQLGHPVQINAYITPAQNQGFSAHYDTHDVFVLQIAGTKRWIVHPPVLEHPLPSQPWDQRKVQVAAAATADPIIDQLLSPGDALYLPRGYIHSATAQGELSVHLTVGMHPITGHRLAETLIQVLRDDPEVRSSLPAGVDLADPTVLAGLLRGVAAKIAAAVSMPDHQLDAVAAAVEAQLTDDTRPAPVAPIAQLAAADRLHGGDQVGARIGLRARIDAADGGVVVRALGKKVTMPPVMAAAANLLLDGRSHRVADLPGLDADEQLVLARRLLREGLLVVRTQGG